MAKGDVQDFVKRLNDVTVPWFGESYPLLTAFFNGFATMDSFIYFLTEYCTAQMRLQTAAGTNLDLIACDFFEGILQRQENMPDNDFRKLIQATLLQEEATVQGMKNAIYTVTGYYPIIWEPFSLTDTAFADGLTTFADGDTTFAGGLSAAYNFWIEVFVDDPGLSLSAFADGANTWADGDITTQSFADASKGNYFTYDQILAIVNRVKVGGTVAHLTLTYI